MFSFKNTELFRYFVSLNLTKNIDKLVKQSDSTSSMLIGSIFSGSFSVLATYISTKVFPISICNVLKYCLVFTSSFILVYFIVKFIIRKVTEIYIRIKPEGVSYSTDETRDIINDFDHIALDNILIANEFIRKFPFVRTKDYKVSTFYYYEVIYYLKVSIGKTERIFVNSVKCLNSPNKTNNIDLFRLQNALDMMVEILSFIEDTSNRSLLIIDSDLIASLDHQISQLKESMSILLIKYEKYKLENY